MTRLLRNAAAAACLAALLAGVPAAAAPTPLPVGTPVTVLHDGSAGVLGLDTGFAAGPGSNASALTDTDLEFLTADGLIAIDLFSSGRIDLYDNGGAGLAGSTVLQLSFAGLLAPLSAAALDVSALAGGTAHAALLDDHTLQLTLTDLQFREPFGALRIDVTTASVPEPAPLALLAVAALGALAASALQRPVQRRAPDPSANA
jgi:hypothetical protein